MITPEPPAGSEHYREGWRHGYEQAAIDRERSADAVRPVPDTGQARMMRGDYPAPASGRTVAMEDLIPDMDAAICGVCSSDPALSGDDLCGPHRAKYEAWLVTEVAQSVPAEPSGDTVQAPAQPDLAYARSEVDKWLADNDPYCILPTRTEHIPALLARLDELEGTR